jgi:DNA-binding beta-propeller fold protein YncE
MKNLCLYLLRSVSGVLLVFLIFSMAVGVGATVEPPPAFLLQWSIYGYPCGVAVDSAGNAYVSDVISHSIQKFDPDGTFLTKWGSYGTGQGEFRYPYGVAVDSEGNVYVADMYNHSIQKFDPDGTFLKKWGFKGKGQGQFSCPYGVAVDSEDHVYVADTNNCRIQKFDPDGTFLKKWGSEGRGQGQFSCPYGVAVDSEGNVYVADTYNHRIQKFDIDGTFLTKWGCKGQGQGQFRNPCGVAVDSEGNVYVADTNNCRIQKFDPDGTFLTKWGSYGQGQGQFLYPYGVAVDSVGCVYVADTENRRIQKFGNPSIDVDIRIKGQSPLNVKSHGVLPVAILGTNTFHVTDVDVATVLLEGVAPLRWAFEDVATSHDPSIDKQDAFNCTTEGPDGLLDLTLKFRTQEVVAALGEVKHRDAVVLTLTANLKDSMPIQGKDVIVILKKP